MSFSATGCCLLYSWFFLSSKLVQFLPSPSDVFIRSLVSSSISKPLRKSSCWPVCVCESLRELGVYYNKHSEMKQYLHLQYSYCSCVITSASSCMPLAQQVSSLAFMSSDLYLVSVYMMCPAWVACISSYKASDLCALPVCACGWLFLRVRY